MTHLSLIEMINRHKDLINQAYLEGVVTDLPLELISSGIFRKIGREYKLADSYIQFANIMLKRADANITFGDYAQEQKKLMDLKSSFKRSDPIYLKNMMSLTGKLFERLTDRDITINAKISDIINDNHSSIEVVIKDAEDINNRISELVIENEKIRILLNEVLMGVDKDLDNLLIDIGIDMEHLNDNITIYIQRLKDFILRSKKRKKQNDKLAAISFKILHEKDEEFQSILLSNATKFYHTIKPTKSPIITKPDDNDFSNLLFLNALTESLYLQKKERKAPEDRNYLEKEPVIQITVNTKKILADITSSNCEDIYLFIRGHEEISKFSNDDDIRIHSFKMYLMILLEYREDLKLTDQFNQYNIKVAKWI